MTGIKICGLKSMEDISCVNKWKPEYIGFVFLKGRARYVTPAQAAEMRKALDPSIIPVGVFVNEPVSEVASLFQNGIIRIAQLHGEEDETYVETLRKLCPCPIIKAFIIKSEKDIQKALSFPCDYLLLDNGLGTGETFDWSLIQNIDRPFFLAGGLNPENVTKAIRIAHPYAVDVSSGVETDGKKDPDKIQLFISSVRSYPL